MALNLEKQLQFYGSYHHDSVNIGIHLTCVPLIFLTIILWVGTNTPPLTPLPSWLTIPNLDPNFGTLIAVAYSSLYIMLEPVAGGLLAPLLLAATAYAKHLTSTYGATANYWSIGINIVSWLAQFTGHGVFEGRAPALLDNIVQALFLAPFFVWIEVLFFFGYRPELKGRIDRAVEKEIIKFKREKVNSEGFQAANGNSIGQNKAQK